MFYNKFSVCLITHLCIVLPLIDICPFKSECYRTIRLLVQNMISVFLDNFVIETSNVSPSVCCILGC